MRRPAAPAETFVALFPTPEQMQSLFADADDQPVVMVNLLRFKARATTRDENLSGEDAYRRYSDRMVEFIASRCARVRHFLQEDLTQPYTLANLQPFRSGAAREVAPSLSPAGKWSRTRWDENRYRPR
jgi:hypothetical protein